MSARAIDVFSVIAPMVGDSGVCEDTDQGKAQIIEALNLAIGALIKRLDSKGTLWYWELPVVGGCFPLPADVLEIRSAWLDGQSLQQRDEWWEAKLSVGINDAGCCWTRNHIVRCGGGNSIIDQGDGYPSPNPWPKHHRNVKLALVADHEGDAGQVVQVIYRDDHNNPVEEFLTLKTDVQPVMTANPVTGIDFISKPVTHGGIKAQVFYDANSRRANWAYYGPRVTIPSYRWKKITYRYPNGCHGTLLIHAKRRFVPIIEETDPLQISDLMALRWGVQAIAAQNRKDAQEYNAFIALAVNELEKEKQNEQSPGASGQIQFQSPFGRAARPRVWN